MAGCGSVARAAHAAHTWLASATRSNQEPILHLHGLRCAAGAPLGFPLQADQPEWTCPCLIVSAPRPSWPRQLAGLHPACSCHKATACLVAAQPIIQTHGESTWDSGHEVPLRGRHADGTRPSLTPPYVGWPGWSPLRDPHGGLLPQPVQRWERLTCDGLVVMSVF